MAKEATAPAPELPADGMDERDYAALLATLSASARGRAFLAEFARRQRAVETEALVAAIARLEETVTAQQQAPAALSRREAEPPPAAAPPVRLNVVPMAPRQTATASLVEVSWYVEEAPSANDRSELAAADDTSETAVIPVVAAPDLPAVDALAAAPAMPPAASATVLLPSDAREQPAPLSDLLVRPSPSDAFEQPAPPSDALQPPAALMRDAREQPPPPASDPLAQLMALTDEERIALFS